MVRCMVGYGVLHVNAFPDVTGAPAAPYTGTAWVVPLHANKGIFSIGLGGGRDVNYFEDPVSGDLVARPRGISTLWLRTFSAANRFQITLFK